MKVDPNGHVVLSTGSQEFHFMWIANNNQGWVSKYDTRTGREVGRYFSVVPQDGLGNGNGISVRDGSGNLISHNPSRTAIDLYGDVWVANRAYQRPATVTKIANDISSCKDRNNDGRINTSRDLNGDGQISTSPVALADGGTGVEFIIPQNGADILEYDECVLFTTVVGEPNVPGGGYSDIGSRAIAISQGFEGSAGDVWVGIYRLQRFYKLDPIDGRVKPAQADGGMYVQLSWGPYGAVVDSKQRLWAVQPGTARLALIDTKTGTLIGDDFSAQRGNVGGCGAYGIGVDGKDRIWLPGWTAGSAACRYEHGAGLDPNLGTWTRFDFSGAACKDPTGANASGRLGRPRGIAVDDQGNVYMSADSENGNAVAKLIRFDAETGAIRPFQTANGAADCIDATDSAPTSQSIGVGIDSDGHPWVNNFSGNATKYDKVTGAVTRTPQQPGGLYTYSDFTGYQLRKFTVRQGTYRKDMMGCGPDALWRRIEWTADVPSKTSLKVFAKVGNSPADLNNTSTPRYGPWTVSPADLQAPPGPVPKGQYLRVEFVLSSDDGQSSPVLKSFKVVWSCEVIPG